MILFLAVIFLFVCFGLFAKENIGGSSHGVSARVFDIASVGIELPLETRLCIDSPF